MDFPKHLTARQVEELKYEVISAEARANVTRTLRPRVRNGQDWPIEQFNRIINQARTVAALGPYPLHGDDWGDYQLAEYAWHQGEFEACVRRLSTAQLIDFLAEMVQDEFLPFHDVNALLEAFNSSARLTYDAGDVAVNILAIDEIEKLHEQVDAELDKVAHPNVRTLVDRMDRALTDDDYSAVLHASASIFETLAKETVASPNVEGETLGGFFAKFERMSGLPSPILAWILEIYKRRNTEPLAGHGKLAVPTVTQDEATALSNMTKAFVLTEKSYQSKRASLATAARQ